MSHVSTVMSVYACSSTTIDLVPVYSTCMEGMSALCLLTLDRCNCPNTQHNTIQTINKQFASIKFVACRALCFFSLLGQSPRQTTREHVQSLGLTEVFTHGSNSTPNLICVFNLSFEEFSSVQFQFFSLDVYNLILVRVPTTPLFLHDVNDNMPMSYHHAKPSSFVLIFMHAHSIYVLLRLLIYLSVTRGDTVA